MYRHYEKLGGWLLIFIICQVFLFVCVILEILGVGFTSPLPNDVFGVQLINLIAVTSPCFCIYYVIKKPKNALLGIRKFLITNSFSWALMIILFFFYLMFNDYKYNSIPPVYILTLVNSIVWSSYFKNSKRAAIYFGLIDSRHVRNRFDKKILIVENPIELEIIDALKVKGATSEETAVFPTDLSINILISKYVFVTNNLLYSQKRIGMVYGKYYLRDVKKGEYFYGMPIKFVKVIMGILISCAVVALFGMAMMFLDEMGMI